MLRREIEPPTAVQCPDSTTGLSRGWRNPILRHLHCRTCTVALGNVGDGGMKMRPRTYLQFISLWRSRRAGRPPHAGDVGGETSPLLIAIAAMLALLLVILEVDLHHSEWEALGLLAPLDPALGPFFGP